VRRQRSLQYFTCSQSRAHFFRQVNGRAQLAQMRVGRCEGGRARLGRGTANGDEAVGHDSTAPPGERETSAA